MSESKATATTSRTLAISLPEDRPNVCVGADTYSIVLKGSDTDEKLSVMDFLIPPGGGPMPHAHGCEETFLVLEGEVVVFCHDQRTLAPTGAAVNVPGWAPHTFHNFSTAPARLLCIISPAGLEREFMEIGFPVATRTTPPPPPDPKKMEELKKRMPEIAAEYNARVLPPDTFDSLMSEEERQLVKNANGE